jgi:hypothetical protein
VCVPVCVAAACTRRRRQLEAAKMPLAALSHSVSHCALLLQAPAGASCSRKGRQAAAQWTEKEGMRMRRRCPTV